MATAGGTVTGGATPNDDGGRMATFERDRGRSSSSASASASAVGDRRREGISGGKLSRRDSGSIRARSGSASGSGSGRSGIDQQTRAGAAGSEAGSGAQLSRSQSRFSSVALPRRLLKGSMAPILSLKNKAGISKDSTGALFGFLVRVAALEAIRRVSIGRCPQVWWGLQGISLLQAPPFSWFQRWAPVRQLVDSTQSFSKPLIFLSMATAVTSAVEEIKHASDPPPLASTASPQPTVEQRSLDRAEAQETSLRETLERAGVDIPERFGDDDLALFSVAANGNTKRFISRVQKSIRWRQNYYFLNGEELERWSNFVYWHDFDIKKRPVLIVHLGSAYRSLQADERPRFYQAVVSQVEFGVLHLLDDSDPRITVIMDCRGTRAIGFPVNMMKSCAVLLQDNYPRKLACLCAINVPPMVRVISSAVFQVVSQLTKQKIKLLGEVYMTAAADLLGGTDKVPASVDGACHCQHCMELRSRGPESHVSHQSDHQLGYVDRGLHAMEPENDEAGDQMFAENRVTDFQSYNNVLRMFIIGFLMLWIFIALVAGHWEPDPSPT